MLKTKKTLTAFRPVILSRHPSHSPLRVKLGKMPFRSIIRLGSTTTIQKYNSRRNKPLNSLQLNNLIEINSVQGIKNSSNKLLMKKCFNRANIKHADWYTYDQNGKFKFIQHNSNEIGDVGFNIDQLPYPIISKHIYGSRGTGNNMINNPNEMKAFISNKDLNNYIFEKYYSYNREYRLHVTKNGCFYACRKMLKNGTPEELRFQRHDDNCVWIIENNPTFDKPVNWDSIVNDCIKALKELDLDIAGFDIKIQSSTDKKGIKRKNPEYIIIESNSACSFGTITEEKYLEELPKLLKDKYVNK